MLCFGACGKDREVECRNNADCNLVADGECLSACSTRKWCVYPDEFACPSGRRWSNFDTGDDLADTCFETADLCLPDASVPPDAMPPCKSKLLFAATGRGAFKQLYTADGDGGPTVAVSQQQPTNNIPFGWNADGSLIGFYSVQSNNSDLFVIDPKGLTGVSPNLTNTPTSDLDAHWSKKGDYIVYRNFTDDTTSGNLHRVSPAGDELVQLTMDPNRGEHAVTWSPLGNVLAYADGFDFDDSMIIKMTAIGGSKRPFAVGSLPAWSPTEDRLLFQSATNPTDIFLSTNDATPINLTNTAALSESSAQWSPTGERFAYFEYDPSSDTKSIFVVDSNGDGKTLVASAPPPETLQPEIAWSPRGDELVFVKNDQLLKAEPGSPLGPALQADSVGLTPSAPFWSPCLPD